MHFFIREERHSISIFSVGSVAVTAEADTALVAVAVALITIVPAIAVPPAAAVKQGRIGGMDTRVGPPDAIVITVTASAAAGPLAAFVTGGAVFHVPPGRFAVVASPGKQ
jgi:hypothetical protein